MKQKYYIQLFCTAFFLFGVDLKAQITLLKQIDKRLEFSKKERSEKRTGIIHLKSLKAPVENQKKIRKYNTTFSVDILNGKGIHMFTISKISSIPSIR